MNLEREIARQRLGAEFEVERKIEITVLECRAFRWLRVDFEFDLQFPRVLVAIKRKVDLSCKRIVFQ